MLIRLLASKGVVEMRRRHGFFVNFGARAALLVVERKRFLAEQWPAIKRRYIERLVAPAQLDAARVFDHVHERQIMGRNALLFDGAARAQA